MGSDLSRLSKCWISLEEFELLRGRSGLIVEK